MIKRLFIIAGILFALGLLLLSVWVELEAGPAQAVVGGRGKEKALVLYHPSRDAHFSDELSLALAQGLMEAGYRVERATTTDSIPATPQGYALLAVVANTYYWTPDLPTLRYLERARLSGIPAIGIIGGAGATGRSQRLLGEALRATGAEVLTTHSYWILRPNDEARMQEPNRQVAMEAAHRLGLEYGRQVLWRHR